MSNLNNRPEMARRKFASRGQTNVLGFPENRTGHSILFVFKEYDYRGYTNLSGSRGGYYSNKVSSSTNAVSRSLNAFNSIELPFPKQLSDNTGLRVNGFEREAISEAVANAITSVGGGKGSSVAESISNITGKVQGIIAGGANALNGIGSDLAKEGGTGNMVKSMQAAIQSAVSAVGGMDTAQSTRAAAYILRQVGGAMSGDVARTIDLVTGAALNPKEALAFEGVNLRSFGFTWELYPHNQQESQTINRIAKTFQRHALPATTDLVPGLFERTFLEYPSTVDIRLLGVIPNMFPEYKPCMMNSVDISFENAAGSVPIMQGGAPGSVTLSVNFTEMSARTREDVEGASGFSNGNIANQVPNNLSDQEGSF
jgi:hypothetical protein